MEENGDSDNKNDFEEGGADIKQNRVEEKQSWKKP